MRNLLKFSSTSEIDTTLAHPCPGAVLVGTDPTNYKMTACDYGKNTEYTITIDASGNIGTQQKLTTYTVILIAGSGGTVSGSGIYTQGTVITITATPSTGYKFTSWSDGDTNASRSITVNSDITLSASFETEVTTETWMG